MDFVLKDTFTICLVKVVRKDLKALKIFAHSSAWDWSTQALCKQFRLMILVMDHFWCAASLLACMRTSWKYLMILAISNSLSDAPRLQATSLNFCCRSLWSFGFLQSSEWVQCYSLIIIGLLLSWYFFPVTWDTRKSTLALSSSYFSCDSAVGLNVGDGNGSDPDIVFVISASGSSNGIFVRWLEPSLLLHWVQIGFWSIGGGYSQLRPCERGRCSRAGVRSLEKLLIFSCLPTACIEVATGCHETKRPTGRVRPWSHGSSLIMTNSQCDFLMINVLLWRWEHFDQYRNGVCCIGLDFVFWLQHITNQCLCLESSGFLVK